MSDAKNKQWVALAGLCLATFILNIDLTVVNIVLPILGRIFKASIMQLQWVNNIYLLSLACSVIPMGKVADIYGHKRVFCYGVIIFALGSLLVGLSPSIPFIISARVIQGIGMAMAFPMAVVLANRIFSGHQRSLALGILVTSAGIGQAVGPTLGGFISEFFGWRYAFLINLPICFASFLLIFYACAKDKTLNKKKNIHYLSVALITAGLSLILLAVNQVKRWGATSTPFLACIASGLVLLILVLYTQRKIKNPLIDLTIYHSRNYAAITIGRALFQFNFAAIIFILPIYLQNILGYSPAISGLIILISTITMAIIGPLTSRFIKHYGIRPPILVAQAFAIIGYGLFTLSGAELHFTSFIIGLCLIGMNVGLTFSSTNYVAVNSVDESMRGLGFGVFVTVTFFLSALGVALSGATIAGFALHKLKLLFASHHISLPAAQFQNAISGAHPIYTSSSTLKPLLLQAFLYGFHGLLWIYVTIACASFMAFCFLRKDL